MGKTLIIAFVIAIMVFTAPATHASGAFLAYGLQSGTQSGSQHGSGLGIDAFPTFRQRDPAAEAYSRGRSLVSKKIGCKKCAHPRGVKDAETAYTVAMQVLAGEFDLKDNERQFVLFYLSNRFGK